MRGSGESNGSLAYTLDIEELVERDHPLRAIKRVVDEALRGMDGDFRRAYSRNGRPSIAPERLVDKGLTYSFLAGVVRQAIDAGLGGDGHFAVDVAEANGRSERECKLGMVRSVRRRHGVSVSTLAADGRYDSGDLAAARERAV